MEIILAPSSGPFPSQGPVALCEVLSPALSTLLVHLQIFQSMTHLGIFKIKSSP